MPIVAIAGGTSPTLGRSIVRAIQSTSNVNTPIILTRHSDSAPKTKWNAAVRQVNYENHVSLVAALHGVHTVISVIKVEGPQWYDFQLNLLRAAKEAGVKRFAPSEFGLGPLADERVGLLALKGDVWDACQESGLEVARFNCGIFMNYLSMGCNFGGDEERVQEALAGLNDVEVIWDLAGDKAEEPLKCDGSSPRITLTDIWDVGKFVAGACELELGKWSGEMEMEGETIEVCKATELLEKYSGRKLEVTKVRRKELQAKAEAIDGMRVRKQVLNKMIAQFLMLEIDEEVGGALMEPTMNKLCPWVRAKSVEEYLQRCWRK